MSTKNLVKGACRLCSAQGYHREVTKEYRCKGQAEVYSEMLMECFNLTIQPHRGMACLICLHCVERLRDACEFRELVYRAATLLRDPLLKPGDGEFVTVSDLTAEDPVIIKSETIKMEITDDVICYGEEDNNDHGFVTDLTNEVPAIVKSETLATQITEESEKDNNDHMNDDEPWPPPEGAEWGAAGAEWGAAGAEWGAGAVAGEAELLARHPHLPRLPLAPGGRFMHYCRLLRGRVITSDDIARLLSDGPAEVLGPSWSPPPPAPAPSAPAPIPILPDAGSEKHHLIANITNVIRHSNATPFRSKTSQGFRCFYCRTPLQNLDEIRAHNAAEHRASDLGKTLWKYGAEAIVVNVDVSDLACKVCEETAGSLTELRRHLEQKHSVSFSAKYTDRMVPFNISGEEYECHYCSCRYETFGSIERHMNTHMRNYVCKVCGNGFVTKYRLKVHLRSLHDNGSWACTACDKVFPSYQKRKTHMDTVHRMVKRFRCPKCSERFTEYFARQKHLVEAHGAAPIKYKCNVCEKEYDRRYALSRHLKKDHLKEKNHQCEECGYKCFTSNELKMHLIKHDGARVHECPVCKKAYARKKTLTEHMKIHNNDRRHVCAACGQAFIQKCSLKGHIKTHHPELTMGEGV